MQAMYTNCHRCTQALAANGAKVYITGRRQDVLEKAAKEHSPTDGSGTIIPIGPCDVTSREDLARLSAELEKKESHLDLFIAAAGIPGPKAPPDREDAQELKDKLWAEEDSRGWNDVLNTNVTAVYFSTVAFLPLLQKGTETHGNRAASVIVISSMSGIMRDSQGHFAYNAAKAATVHLAKMMSHEFEKIKVRVNSIAPGYFPSELTMKESDSNNKSYMPPEKVRDKGHPVPADRAGSDDEMAMAVLFLAKNVYVNGEILPVDGGVLNQVAR